MVVDPVAGWGLVAWAVVYMIVGSVAERKLVSWYVAMSEIKGSLLAAGGVSGLFLSLN
jgi:hypothetical protein